MGMMKVISLELFAVFLDEAVQRDLPARRPQEGQQRIHGKGNLDLRMTRISSSNRLRGPQRRAVNFFYLNRTNNPRLPVRERARGEERVTDAMGCGR